MTREQEIRAEVEAELRALLPGWEDPIPWWRRLASWAAAVVRWPGRTIVAVLAWLGTPPHRRRRVLPPGYPPKLAPPPPPPGHRDVRRADRCWSCNRVIIPSPTGLCQPCLDWGPFSSMKYDP